MREGIISTHDVHLSADGQSVEVVATLDAGIVIPGMFVHIPLNSGLDFTVKIAAVTAEADGRIRLVLDCGGTTDDAGLVLAFNFEDETLWVLETGED